MTRTDDTHDLTADDIRAALYDQTDADLERHVRMNLAGGPDRTLSGCLVCNTNGTRTTVCVECAIRELYRRSSERVGRMSRQEVEADLARRASLVPPRLVTHDEVERRLDAALDDGDDARTGSPWVRAGAWLLLALLVALCVSEGLRAMVRAVR